MSLTSGNEGKKNAVAGRKTNSRKTTRSIEEDKYNAELELSTEEEKENKTHQPIPRDDENEQFDLAIEGQTSKKFEPELNGDHNFVTPRSTGNAQSSGPAILTKPQNAHVFAPSLILDPSNVRASLKRPAADSTFLFGDLFITRKSIRANPTDNEVLLQVLEKIEELTNNTT